MASKYRWCNHFMVVIIVCFNVIHTQATPQIHRLMTSEELRNVFQVDSVEQVPHYQLAHTRSLHKRSTSDDVTKEVHISVFGRDFRLQLERNEHLSKMADRLKMYEAQVHTDGNLNITEIQLPVNGSDVGDVYQDATNGAAVLLHRDNDGSLLLDGTIGSGLTIKPAPSRVRNSTMLKEVFPDDEMFMDNELPSTDQLPGTKFDTTGMHIVYKMAAEHRNETAHSDYMFMEPDQLRKRSTRSIKRQKRETQEAVWPEILVIVDYDSYNMHGGNNMDIKRYFISFWNGVDLRYKLLGGPKVRISLAGIIISKGRDATPYLENNRVGGNAVDSAGALTELGKYLFRERRLPTYDIAVVVTKLDLCRREYQLGACNKGTAVIFTIISVITPFSINLLEHTNTKYKNTIELFTMVIDGVVIFYINRGFAYVGGACVVNKRLEKVNSVAIIEDTGGFSGIIVAAHEVGHLLGAVHDGSPPPSYLGGPGAEHCRWEDGYIMSDLRHTERGFKWSICSVQQFKHFLNGDTAKCLYNIPHEDDELPRLLPGKLLSLDSQCRKDRGTSACFKDDRVCAQLFCFDSRSGYCVSYRPAAEGSPCGDGHYCINGRCVPENENVIPDYSRVSEIVVPKPSGFQPSLPPPLERSDDIDFHSINDSRKLTSTPQKQIPLVDSDGGGDNESARRLQLAPNRKRLISTGKSQFEEAVYDDVTAAHRNPFNLLNKSPEKQVFQPEEEAAEDNSAGCRDLMRELAGGLTCKQFLRRFGSRYCNHHFIIANCCSSRKILCDV
ncbi:hypothetical protein CHUAL_006316 [Chamberlinius hualienensis]